MKKLYLILALLFMTAGLAPVSSFAAWSGYRIMLDPGHGGSDPGASGPSAPHEAELALRCCNAMADWLRNTAGTTAYKLTRTSNTSLSLSSRRSMSISYDPYIFCSVHLNAFNGSANGTETWYYWSAGNSSKLASKVQASLVAKLGRVNRGVKQNGWTVITGASTIPAILTEGLFVDNSTEWGMINTTSKQGFKNWVNGHLKGFYDYLTGQGYSLNVNPDSNPYGGAVTPPPTPTPSGSISVPSGMHFTGYVGEEPELELAIKAANMKTSLTVKANYAARFPINGTTDGSVTVSKTGGTVKVKFADPYHNNVAGTYGAGGSAVVGGTSMNINFKITISGTGEDGKTVTKEVALTAELKNKPLAPKEKWNLSEKKGTKTSKGYDAGKIRNFCYNKGKLYCVYDHKDILVLNAQTGEKLGFLHRAGVVKGGTLQLCDVKVLNNVIVACNLAIAANGEQLRLYAWRTDNGTPELILNTSDFNGAQRLGDCLEMTGNFDSNAVFAFGCAPTTASTRIVEFTRAAGKWSSKYTDVYIDANKTNLSTQSVVRAYPQSAGWWVDGKDSYPTWVVFNSSVGGAVRSTLVDTGESWGSCHHEFNFGGQKYSANLVFNGKEYNADGSMNADKNYKGAKMRIIADLTGDFTRMQQLGDYPADGLGDESRNTNATGDVMVNTDGQTYFEGWVLSTLHGIAYYTHGSVPAQSPGKLELQEPEPDTPVAPTITANPTSIFLSCTTGQQSSATVDVTAANISGNITATLTGDNAFSITPATLSASGKITVTYTPAQPGSHSASIILSSAGANDVTVTLNGTAKEQVSFSEDITADKLQQKWIFSTNTAVGPWYLATDNFTTSIALKDGKLYALNCKSWSAPEIVEVDAYTGAQTGKKLSVNGITGGTFQLGSIFFIGDKLYGTNVVTASQPLKIYRWDSLSGDPTCIVTDNTHDGVVTGRRASYVDGKIWLVADGAVKAMYYPVSNGTVAASPTVITLKKADNSAFFDDSADGRGGAAVVDGGNGTFWIVSKKAAPTHFNADGSFIEQMKPAALADNIYGADMAIIPFGVKTYVAATTYKDAGKVTNGQMVLVDASDGIANAGSYITVVPEQGLGATTNDQFCNTIIHAYRNNNQTLDLWVCVPKQGVAHYSYDGRTTQGILDFGDSDTNDTDVRFFNLQGIEVPAESLTPGVYIRRAQGKAVKVLIK